MQVTFVHVSDWYIPSGDAMDVLGKYKLPACSYRDGDDWDTFKAKAILAGLRLEVLQGCGETTAALILKGKVRPDPKPKEDFFPVPAEETPFPVIGDQT